MLDADLQRTADAVKRVPGLPTVCEGAWLHPPAHHIDDGLADLHDMDGGPRTVIASGSSSQIALT